MDDNARFRHICSDTPDCPAGDLSGSDTAESGAHPTRLIAAERMHRQQKCRPQAAWSATPIALT
jgi:hypothetical protein